MMNVTKKQNVKFAVVICPSISDNRIGLKSNYWWKKEETFSRSAYYCGIMIVVLFSYRLLVVFLVVVLLFTYVLLYVFALCLK